MVNVICENCGKLYDLPEEESIDDYECIQCNGNLKYHRKIDSKNNLGNEIKRQIISYKTIHAERQSQYYFCLMIAGLIIISSSIIAVFLFNPLLLFYPFYISILIGILMFLEGFNLYKRWSKGSKGEKLVAHELNELPEDYYVFNDLMIPTLRGNIDHVVIGPTGIYALETKNYSTNYTINGDDWTQYRRPDKIIRKDPGKQAIRSAKGLKKYLAQKGLRGLKWVNALVVLINDDTYEIKTIPKNYYVLNHSLLNDFIIHGYNQLENKNILEISLILKNHCSEFSYVNKNE